MKSRAVYVLFEWAGDSFDRRVPVLARRDHCVFFGASVPFTALQEECAADLSMVTRSTSSPVSGADLVRSWTTRNGSWNRGQPVGSETVRWCFITLVAPFSLLSLVNELFGGWFSAAKDNEKRHVKQWHQASPGAMGV